MKKSELPSLDPTPEQLLETIKKLRETIDELTSENKMLKKQLHEKANLCNTRNAGRKKRGDDLQTGIVKDKIKVMMDSGKSDTEIKQELNLAHATFYRYKKCILEESKND